MYFHTYRFYNLAITPLHNEQLLLQEISKGDERAFTELFDWYYRKLGEYVLKVTDSFEVTEEIVQDVFIKIWLKRETLSDVKNFSDYLFILSRNQTISYLRKKATEASKQEAWEQEQIGENFSDELSTAEEWRSAIEKVISKLPPQQQKILLLSRYDRLKHEEIAKKMGISPKTVKKHLQIAMKTIRQQLSSKNNTVILLVLLSPLII